MISNCCQCGNLSPRREKAGKKSGALCFARSSAFQTYPVLCSVTFCIWFLNLFTIGTDCQIAYLSSGLAVRRLLFSHSEYVECPSLQAEGLMRESSFNLDEEQS